MATSGAGLVDREHAARHLPDRELAGAGHGARLEDDVGLRRRLAGQDQAGASSSALSALLLVRAVDDAALEHAALARAAGAVLAAVGQADALADGGLQDRLVALDAEAAPARLDGDGEGHADGGAGAAHGILRVASDWTPRFCPRSDEPDLLAARALAGRRC